MIVFLRRHWISITLLILSSIIGLVMMLKGDPIDIWRVEYEFNTVHESKLLNYQKVDTVIQSNGIICRNFTGSIADTLQADGIRRHELKMYIPHPSHVQMIKRSDLLLRSPYVRIVNRRFRESQRNKRELLYWMLFGFFLGMVVEFVIALKKKPRTN